MADDVNANIRINIDTATAAAQLQVLENSISDFNKRVVQSNAQAVAAQKASLSLLQSKIGDIGKFSTQIRTIETSVGGFSRALEKGKLSFGEYFRYGLASTKTFGRAFTRELDLINSTAEDRVKKLSTRYVALGKQADGMQKVLAIRPEVLPTGLDTQLAMAAQKQQIFNQLLRQGSTHLVNWGKNTQWAGRQLMVGFTIPLTIFGGIAAQTFMDLERQAINFKRVYGDAFTPPVETDLMLEQVKTLSAEFTKYGITAADTMNMAAKAAATGAKGADLIAQTTEATRLATLGQIEQQQALDATIALQSAFRLDTIELTEAVNFLNAVENQTVVSLDDVTQAIPRAATVIQGLGGNVQDLAAFLAAMRENGVNAAEGANALKSGLASLINPTKQAREQLEAVGIDINTIIETNRGDLMGTVQAFAQAVNALDPLTRQQTLAQVFGKYQFARLGALFENIARDGSQASRVLQLMGEDVSNLAALSEKELGAIENAVGIRFTGAVERLKLALAPIGEIFLRIATPIVEGVTRILETFNSLPDAVKTSIAAVIAIIGGIAPVFLMGIGLIGNGIGNMTKGFLAVRNIYQRMVSGILGNNNPLAQSFGFMTDAELDAAAAAGTLDGKLDGLTSTVLIQEGAVNQLTSAYRSLSSTMSGVAMQNPQGFMPRRGGAPRRMARGGQVPGKGNKDSEPALLMPGEFVINKEASEKFAPILEAMNNGTLKGYAQGRNIRVPSTGEEISLNLPDKNTQRTVDAIYTRLAKAADLGAGELEIFVQVLRDMSTQVETSASIIDEAVRQIPEITSIAQPESSGAPTNLLRQSQRMDWSTKSAEINAIQSEIASKWPEIAEDTKKMRNLTNTQASHLEVINAAGERVDRDWTDLANITPDLGAMNNYLNRIKNITLEAEDLERIMRETGLSQAQVETEVDKLRREIHPITTEAQKVYVSIAKLDEQLSLAAGGLRAAANTKTRIGTVAQSGYQATAVAAAGQARMAAPQGADFYSTINDRQYQAAGTRIATAINSGIEQGNPGIVIEQEVMQNARAASPPPWSFILGNWIGDGINAGMQQSIQQPRLSPSQMRGAVMLGGETQIPQVPINTKAQKQIEELGLSAGVAASANQKDAAATNMEAAAHVENTDATNAESNAKKKGAGGFRGMLYALDGLSLAMSFLPGPLGEIANKVFIASAAFSALDAMLRIQIIQGALTKLKTALIAAAAASGLKTAGQGVSTALSVGGDIATTAALAKGGGKVGKVGGIFAKLLGPLARFGALIGRLLPAIGRLVLAAGKFVGVLVNGIPGIGQIISALIILGTTIAGFAIAYKSAGDEIRKLGETAKFAGDDLKSIAEKFGIVARTSGFQQQGTVLGQTEEARSLAEEARTFVAEDSNMQARVQNLAGATDQQAQAIFNSMMIDLMASFGTSQQGRDTATALVEAIALEAGKKDIFVPIQAELKMSFDEEGNIKDISKFISNNLNPAIETLQTSLDNLSNQGFNQAIDQGAIDDAKKWIATVDMLPEVIQRAIVPQYDQKRAILDTASSFNLLKTNSQTAMNLLSAELVNGKIDIDKFNQGMLQIQNSLAALPNNQGLEIMRQQLVELYPQSEGTVRSINDAEVAFNLLSLAAQNVNMSGFIQQMASSGMSVDQVKEKLNELIRLQGVISSTKSEISRIEAALAEEKAKPTGTKGTDGTGGTKDPFAARENLLRNQRAEITVEEVKIDRTADARFKKELQNRFGSTKINIGGINVDTLDEAGVAVSIINEQIEDLEKGPLQAAEDDIERINDEIKIYQDQIDTINRDIDLQEQAISAVERQYKSLLDPLRQQKQAQEDILKSLEDQMAAATRPIENRIAELERELRVAQEAAKPRLDALDEEEKALDNQTELLDDQITSIEEQKDALTEVAKINEFIARQQKNRLSLTQALAEGDIYAATAAAQQMRQDSAEQATEQQQNAFDAQKDSLEDQKKLIQDKKDAIQDERDLIQESFDAIQKQIDAQEYQKFLIEDSYRLQIQAASDAIIATDNQISSLERERDARIKPYQDIIDNYGPKLTALNNAIYGKEQDIKKIQEDRIKPIKDQIGKLNEQRDVLEDIRGDIELEIEKEKLKYAERKKYLDQELEILAAKREIADLSTGGGGGGTAGTPGQQDPKKIADLEAKLADAQAKLKRAEEQFVPPAVVTEKGWFDGIVEGAKNAWTGFTTWFDENVIQPVKNAWNTVYAWIDTNLIQPLKNAWNTISDNAKAVADTIGAFFVAIWQIIDEELIQPLREAWNKWYAEVVQPKLDAIIKKWEEIKLAFQAKFNEIKTFFITWWNISIQPKLDIIADWWEKVRGNFVEKFNAIKDFFIGWWNDNIQPKINLFVEIWEKVRAAFVEKFEAIGTWWDEWKSKTFDDKVEAMKNGLKSLFDPETWKGWFRNAMDGLLGVGKSIVNKLVALFNSIKIKIPSDIGGIPIPFVGGKEFGFNTPEPFPGYNSGGKVMKYAAGNIVGDGSRDSVSAMLTPGEFVVRKAMVDKYGTPMFNSINQGSFDMPRFNTSKMKSGGRNVKVSTNNNSQIVSPMYNNYSVNVSVSGTSASADEIANKTIMKIKQMQNMQIRSGRGY